MKRAEREQLRRVAAEAILKHLKALEAQAPGVRAGRAVPVHDLRVASRRLRIALKLANQAAPSKRCRRWIREIKRLTQALGRARDTDVQSAFLREFLKGLRDPRCRPAVRRLLLRLRRRRAAEQAEVVRELDRFRRRRTAQAIRREFSSPTSARKLAGQRVPEKRGLSPFKGTRHVARLLETMLAYERFIARPERRKELHRMRIAAKHLRYAMEAFAPLCGDRLDPWLRATRRVQTDLGEIHDCDLWIHETLPQFLAGERGAPALKPGVAALMRDRAKRRKALHRAFLKRWKKLRRKRTFERLAEELAR